MQRPNLAGRPFENTRPVWVAGAFMAILAVVLSAINISEALGARDTERAQGEKLQSRRLGMPGPHARERCGHEGHVCGHGHGLPGCRLRGECRRRRRCW